MKCIYFVDPSCHVILALHLIPGDSEVILLNLDYQAQNLSSAAFYATLSNPPKPGDEFVRFLYGRI